MSDRIRVFLVDDQELVRAGFAMLVGSQPDLEVVGQAANGAEAVELLAVTAADVVIMDVRMPRMDGVQATQVLTDRASRPGGEQSRRASGERAPVDGGAMSEHAFPFAKSDDTSGSSTLARGGEQSRRASGERAPVDGGAMSEHAFPFAKSDDTSGSSTLARGGEQSRRASGERAPVDGGAMSEHAFPFAKSDDTSGSSTLARGGEQRVVLLTTFDLDEYAFAGLRAGAAGFLLKDTPPADLLAAIRTVHAGEAVIAPSTTRRLIERFVAEVPVADAPVAPSLAVLTEREREVLLEIALGLSNPEIAAKFVVSEATIKTHVGRILAKTGLRDRVRLVILAYEAGLVRPPRA